MHVARSPAGRVGIGPKVGFVAGIGRAEAGHDGPLEYESWLQLIVELIRGPRAGKKCGQGSRTLVLKSNNVTRVQVEEQLQPGGWYKVVSISSDQCSLGFRKPRMARPACLSKHAPWLATDAGVRDGPKRVNPFGDAV